MKKIGIYIPGRLCSERLPNKLILPFGESCLFDIACSKLDILPDKYNKYVLVNDDELIEIAQKYKNIKIIKRSKESVEAEGPLSFIFRDLKVVEDTHLMFLNPCLAFLKAETIEDSLEKFEQSENDYATSVKTLQNWILDKNGLPLNDINYKRLTTKDIDPLLQIAHCFHIFHKDYFFIDGMMLKKDFLSLPVDGDETIDVDTKEDYQYAKWKWENEICY